MTNSDQETAKATPDGYIQVSIGVGGVIGSAIGANATVIASTITDRLSLRDWWHDILRVYGRYPCSAIFLLLPSDKEARTYFVDYGKEIDLLSGDNCLVIALSDNDFKSVSFDNNVWRTVAEEHSDEGHSIKVARLFDIDFTQFPCVVFFNDIRSSDYSIISFKGLAAQEISNKMRSIFSAIQEAVESKQSPVATIRKHKNLEFVKSSGKIAAAKTGSFAEKTFETAMQAWIKALIA